MPCSELEQKGNTEPPQGRKVTMPLKASLGVLGVMGITCNRTEQSMQNASH